MAEIVQRAGMFVGSDLNRSLEALDFAAFFDRWVGRELPPEAAAELRALVARQHAEADGAAWGWKEPRSIFLLPFFAAELPGLRFLHVVRDGRDMAFSRTSPAAQARRRGARPRWDEAEALRSIALWREINLRAADYGERELGDRYLRLRFEDLCARAAGGVAECSLLRARRRRRADRRRGGAGAADARPLARSRARAQARTERARRRRARALRLPVLVCVEARPHVSRPLAQPLDLLGGEVARASARGWPRSRA